MHELVGIFLTAFFIGLGVDIFLLPSSTLSIATDIRLFVLLLFWLLLVRMFKFSSIATFKLTLVLVVVLSVLFIIARDHQSVERVASWVYIFLATGIIQQLIETRKESKEPSPKNE